MELKDFLLSYFSSEHYQPARVRDLIKRFGLKDQDQLDFYHLMDDLLAEGLIQISDKGQIKALTKADREAENVQEEDQESDRETNFQAKHELNKKAIYAGLDARIQPAETISLDEIDAGFDESESADDELQNTDEMAEEQALTGEEGPQDQEKERNFLNTPDTGSLNASVEAIKGQSEAKKTKKAEKAKEYGDECFISEETEEENGEELPDPLSGRLSGSEKGFAFFISDDESREDVFIDSDNLNGALNGDRVRIKIIKEADLRQDLNPEGRVVEILARNSAPIVGTYQKFSDFGFVVSDNKKNFKDLYIDESNSLGAENGEKVVARIDRYDSGQDHPEGHITEILGPAGEKGVDITAISRAFELPYQFSEESLAEAKKIPTEVSAEERKGRKDLRKLFTVTIDGADAKDFDDAISAQKKGRFYNLYVHIADVSHYVQPGSAIDRDAYERGNSVYLLDRVIPMLPEELSNGICSLNPGKDRLAITTQMTLDRQGKLVDYQFYRSVIQSDRRLVYTDVSDYLEEGRVFEDNKALLQALNIMNEIYELLASQRVQRGALDFDIAESKITLDSEGRAINVSREERRVANRIIEEFMILNNEVIGRHFFEKKLPFIYRIHDEPSKERIQSLNKALFAFGYPGLGKNPKPADFQRILEKAEGSPEEAVLNRLVLQSMQKAIYSPKAIGHFGLAVEHYSHFTAPIRRYSDLIAHRLVKALMDGKPRNDEALKRRLLVQARHVSDTEQKAVDAERDVVDMKSAEYMQQYVGEYFKGVVSDLTNFGIFVMLDNTVEGLVHFRTMQDDYYTYDEDHFEVHGERSRRVIHYGDPVKIQVIAADPQQRTIDFALSSGFGKAYRGNRKSSHTRPTASHARGSKESNAFRRERAEGRRGYKPSKSNRRTVHARKKFGKKKRH